MTQAILQDMSLCMECQGCRVSCQMQNGLQADQVFIKFRFAEQGTYPKVTHQISRFTCLHCADAACVQACPTGAVYKGKTNLTHFDADRCSGCGYCAQVCPFGIPEMRENRALRCVGCESLTENGKPPACVSTCIAGALSYGTREEMLKKAEKRVAALKKQYPNAQVYSPEGVGGTNLIWVLRDHPDVYGLPATPKVEPSLGLWKEAIQPAGTFALAGTLLLGGLGFIVARRNHLKEMHERGEQHDDRS